MYKRCYLFLSSASSKCQAHGICQLSHAVGDDVGRWSLRCSFYPTLAAPVSSPHQFLQIHCHILLINVSNKLFLPSVHAHTFLQCSLFLGFQLLFLVEITVKNWCLDIKKDKFCIEWPQPVINEFIDLELLGLAVYRCLYQRTSRNTWWTTK